MAGFRTGMASWLVSMVLLAGCGGDASEGGLAAEDAARAELSPEFLYGRVTTTDDRTYRGRLRFGGDEEAFWADYFNGVKAGNPWADYVPARDRPNRGISILGFRFGGDAAMRRPFMVRMGDIAELEADGRHLWVTLRSGTRVHLDRWSADDFADGVRVWDDTRGVMDIGERDIRRIEFLPAPAAGPGATGATGVAGPAGAGGAPSYRLHGTVHTAADAFTGFVQWARRGGVALDELQGRDNTGTDVALPFATIRSIERHGQDSARITLLDGRTTVLADARSVSEHGGGVYVDDPRYGRVLVGWDAFRRLDFTPVGTDVGGGPSWDDFPTGRPLAGSVTTTGGQRHGGRIVFDLDESENTATLDAPRDGVDYTIPFSLVRAMDVGGGRGTGPVAVTLHNGERVALERSGDLGRDNAGILIFVEGRDEPVYVRWDDVARIEFP